MADHMADHQDEDTDQEYDSQEETTGQGELPIEEELPGHRDDMCQVTHSSTP